MISVKNLHLSFASSVILKDISFDVPAKGIAVVLGKNGSGKSVLLKCIAALLPFKKGAISIDNSTVSSDLYDYHENKRSLLGYVFQRGGLFDSMTVFDNVAFGMRRHKMDEQRIKSTVLSTLERVGLPEAHDKLPSELSGGMQKRVSLARSLCLNPQVILYDDPTAGLDPVLTDSIADLILDIRETSDVTSMIVTHDLKLAAKVADSVILLYNGETVYNGSSEGFFSKVNPYARQFIEGDDQGPIDIY